jgi:HAD superfamily hydrolase (TIGR01509 family)
MTSRTARPAGVILDFDGLIVDTETPILAAWQEVYRAHGCELGIEHWQHALGTAFGFDPHRHLCELTGRSLDRDTMREDVERRNWAACSRQPLLPGVLDLLAAARDLRLGVAVASSSTLAWLEHWLQAHAIRHLIDAVCGRDDVARVKPEPDVFLCAAARLVVEPERCVVFEDSPNGMHAARRAGMRCVAVPNVLTRQLPLPEVDLVLSSLAERPLPQILRTLGLEDVLTQDLG